MNGPVAMSMIAIFVVAGCGGLPTGTPAAPPLATASPSPAHAATLPVFAANEPLVLFTQVTGAGGGIFVARPAGSGIQQLATDVPGVHKRGDWSPDGQRVLFIDETTERMFIAHLDGSPTEAVAVCDTPGCDFPSWSPDGGKVVFSRSAGEAGGAPASLAVNVTDLETDVTTTVLTLGRPRLADVPRWSGDGTQIVFGVDEMDDDANETGAAVAIVPVSGGAPRYLTEFALFGYAPDWSWAANEIVFSTDIAGLQKDFDPAGVTWDLWLIHPDGTDLRRLTHATPGQRFASPRWSPDGTKVTAYDKQLGGGVIVDVATGRVEPFVTSGNYTRPIIRPIP